jgi:hypothetical protein
MKNVIIITDFLSKEIAGLGGAQLYNEELLKLLSSKYNVILKKSKEVDIAFLNERKDDFFIVSNFILLGKDEKLFIENNLNYSILEHDHKYCDSNNPAIFKDFVIPEGHLINKSFFKKARAVFCQTAYHSKILEKNLFLDNIVNLSCNLWSMEEIALLESLMGTKKEYKYSIFNTPNINKGTLKAINYCRQKDIHYHEIHPMAQKTFLTEVAKSENIVFFPTWVETFSRVAVEARILGCKLITNNLIGALHEPFFSKKGADLLAHIKDERDNILSKFSNIIDNSGGDIYFKSFEKPKASIIATFYNSKKYMKNFMESVVKQTYFKNTEFIIVDAASTEDEQSIIKEYQSENIKYIRLEDKKNIPESFNLALKEVKTDFVGFVCVDDYMSSDHVEVLTKTLFNNPDIDLAYGTCLQTNKENETLEKNSSFGAVYEHSLNDFSRENMIKCLPGPMPMFRMSMLKNNGYFNESLKYANDWELWLRCVRGGSKFKKVNFVSGLYYNNPSGMSTSNKHALERRQEEKGVFNEYKDVLGSNYDIFAGYFNSV